MFSNGLVQPPTTPLKINIEPKNEGLEDHFPFFSWVICRFHVNLPGWKKSTQLKRNIIWTNPPFQPRPSILGCSCLGAVAPLVTSLAVLRRLRQRRVVQATQGQGPKWQEMQLIPWVHPGKINGWNPKNGGLEDDFPFNWVIVRLHVNFQGCICCKLSWQSKGPLHPDATSPQEIGDWLLYN